ncbi:MAG: hypothetical protein AB7G11_11840 [Phycisphaerales bacterium]
MSTPTLSLPPLALALAGLPREPRAEPLRDHLDLAASIGYRFVTLDASLPGTRPRELDRSARRDLAALLRRRELSCAGIDLWIPPDHFTAPAQQDRALAAVLAAIDFAADLARLSDSAVVSTAPSSATGCLSLSLPPDAPPDLLAQADTRAQTCGVRIANHATPLADPRPDHPSIGAGIDPAALLLASSDPAAVALSFATSRSHSPLALARLSDASTVSRVHVGSRDGRLDLLAYALALVTIEYPFPVPVELRGLTHPPAAARDAFSAWHGALPAL